MKAISHYNFSIVDSRPNRECGLFRAKRVLRLGDTAPEKGFNLHVLVFIGEANGTESMAIAIPILF